MRKRLTAVSSYSVPRIPIQFYRHLPSCHIRFTPSKHLILSQAKYATYISLQENFDACKCQISFQLNDSSLIISILRTYLLKQDSLEQLLNYYPPITVEGSNDKKTVEYANRYGIMYKHDFSESELREIK
jgi:hypothetical protein